MRVQIGTDEYPVPVRNAALVRAPRRRNLPALRLVGGAALGWALVAALVVGGGVVLEALMLAAPPRGIRHGRNAN